MPLVRGRRRWIALGITVIVLGAGGTGAWALTRSAASTVSANLTLVAASTGDVQQTVTTTGTIEPARDSDLAFDTSGTVTSVAAVVGRKVTKGTVLATVGSSTQATAITTAAAGVTAAKQELASLSGASTTQIAAAEAQLGSARTTLAQAQDDLKATQLTAPFTGVVAAVGYAVGDTVGSASQGAASQGAASQGGTGTGTGGATTTTTTAGITLITTNAWVVNATVGSADLAGLRKGLQAVITPTGSATKVFGTIASLGIVATSSTSGNATFPVVIDVTGDPTGLYAGSSADVSLVVSQLSNVLSVPTQALHTVDGKTVVYKHVSGKRVTTAVTIGTSYGPTTQIKSGLASGDQVEVTFGAGRIGTRRPGTTGTGGGTGQPPAGFGGGFAGGNG